MNILNKVLFSVVILSTSIAFGQAPTDCNNGLDPICGNAALNFTAQSGVTDASVTNPGNNYDCLFSSPNPTWYYFEVSQTGDLDFSLSAPSDIDFIIYGPFTDSTDAAAGCNSYGNGGAGGNVIDCSYSATNMETPYVANAQLGEVYVLLITNYANQVQDVTFEQVGGTGSTDCNIVTQPPCQSNPGTFVYEVNNQVTTLPIHLCFGDDFSIISNDDYVLPNDTIAQPVGDGIYSAQLMWLVYSDVPTSNDPSTDPNFLNTIIPSEDLTDANNSSSQIIQNFGCGTYYFVPVAGDDGIGGNGNVANGVNDNGGLDWDKNNNNCYQLGNPIEVTYACEITTTSSVNCNYPSVINGIDVDISGGTGNFNIVNMGAGNLSSTQVNNPGTVTISGLNNNDSWNIQITDDEGCVTSTSGSFSAPIITDVTITPAPDCPVSGTGDVDVTINGSSGQGSPYDITLAGNTTTGTSATYSDVAGTIVPILVEDAAGCIADSTVTITSSGHFIDVVITDLQGEQCYGDGNGAATIQATPQPSGTVTSIVWTDPNGSQVGNTNPSHTTENTMMPGVWTVCVTDDVGCEVCVPVEITAPQELDIFLLSKNYPSCYGFSDASIQTNYTGGVSPVTYSWSHDASLTNSLANVLSSGTYTTYVTDANGCMDSLVTVIEDPDSLHAYYTIKNINCYGDSTGGIIIDSVAGNFGNVYYVWDMQGQAPTPSSSTNLASDLPAGQYVLTITDSNGCSNEYQWTLTQNPQITAEVDTRPAYCRVNSSQNGNGVVIVNPGGGVPGYDVLWTEVATGNTSNNTTWGPNNSGDFVLLITDNVGCTYTETVHLDSVSPIADFTVISSELNGNLEGTSPVNVVFENQSQYFANEFDPNADTTFFWNLDETVLSTWQITHYYEYSPDTVYNGEKVFNVCLVAKNKNGCTDTACKEIIVHDIPALTTPNVFTPNNDGKNDLFTFDSLSQGVSEFHAVITDRWGIEVAQITSITDGWDGNNKNGTPCNDGVYFFRYEVTFTNGETRAGQGSVTLIRND